MDSQLSTAQSIEGATIAMSLSSRFTVPGAVYTLKGETQVGKEPVKLHVEIKSAANKVEAMDIMTDKLQKFQKEITAEKNLMENTR